MGVNIDFVGRDRVTDLIEKQNRKLDEQQKKLKGISTSSKEAERIGRRLWEQTRTPLEKYNASLSRAKALLDTGRISQQTYARAVDQARVALERQTRAQQNSVNPRAISQIRRMATAYLSVQTAAQAAGRAIQFLANERRNAAEGQRSSAAAFGKLAQLDPSNAAALKAQARDIFAGGLGATPGEAAEFLFAIQSSPGAADELKTFTDLGRSFSLEQPAQTVGAAGAFRAAFKGRAGTFREIISRAIPAQREGKASIDSILQAAAEPAKAAAALDVAPSELLAATAIGTRETRDPFAAGTQARAFFTALRKRGGFKGKTIAESVREIENKGLSDEDKIKFFGRIEGLQFQETLAANLTELGTLTGEVRRAKAQDATGQLIAANLADPTIQAVIENRRVKAEKFIAEQATGNLQLRREAGVLRAKASVADEGTGARLGAGVGGYVAETFGAEPSSAEFSGRVGAAYGTAIQDLLSGQALVDKFGQLSKVLNRVFHRRPAAVPQNEN